MIHTNLFFLSQKQQGKKHAQWRIRQLTYKMGTLFENIKLEKLFKMLMGYKEKKQQHKTGEMSRITIPESNISPEK